MVQIHKRFTDEQVRMLFRSYNQGQISRTDVQEMLGIGRARFFVLLKDYRQDPQARLCGSFTCLSLCPRLGQLLAQARPGNR
jgi:hypothetical protein